MSDEATPEGPYPYRHTKIIATLGPATESEEMLAQLIRARVDVVRLNMAHATHDWVREIVARIRSVSAHLDREVAIMMDVKGPEIRTGDVDEPLELHRGDKIDFVISPEIRHARRDSGVPTVDVNYPGLMTDLTVGDTVLVDNGLMRMRVEERTDDYIRCEVRIGGTLASRRHINLPGIKINLPALTEKDKGDIDVGIEAGIDLFALSFAREPGDITLFKTYLHKHNANTPIFAKIEDQSAIKNIEAIIEASDGLMVARGDLGIEIPFENLPIVQREAVLSCKRKGKPVIIATHMLESMIEQPLPTRAEISDVANAIFEKADCVMLSGETTIGKYPVECVETFDRVARRIEDYHDVKLNTDLIVHDDRERLVRSAAYLAQDLDRCGILVFTRSGHLTNVMSALRPIGSPIFGFTDNPATFRQMLYKWGIEPFFMPFSEEAEETILHAFKFLGRKGWIKVGDKIVVITNVLANDKKIVDSIQLRIVE